MTTSQKLWLGFGTLTALLLLSGVAILVRVWSLEGQVDRMANVARPRAAAARELEVNVVGYALNVRTFTQTDDPNFRKKAAEAAAEAERHLADYQRLAMTEQQRELATRFAALWRDYKDFSQVILNSNDRLLKREDSERLAEMRMGLEKILNDEMQPEAVENFETRKDATFEDARSIVSFAVTLLVMGVVIAVVTSVAVGRAVVGGERAIAEQGERLRTTLASIGDAVISTDASGNVTYLNAVAESLTGWTNDEAAGMPLTQVFNIVNESTRQPVENPALRALNEGVIVGLANHTVLIAKDGTERPIDDSAAPIRCVAGELVGCVLVFRDISERHRAEAREKAQQDRVQLVADAVPSLISYIDADAHYRLNNRAYETWFGHPQGELVGRHMRNVLGESAWAAVRPHVEAALAGQVVSYEAEVPYRDGGTRWIMATYTPDFADGAVQGVVAHVTDISALKRAERQVATTLESVTDGFMRYDRDWRIVYLNAEAERINQLTRSEMLGKVVWEVFPAVVGTKLELEFRRSVAEQVTVEFENHYEPFGRWYSLKCYPTPDGGLTTYIRDITEKKQAEEQLRESEERFRGIFSQTVAGVAQSDMTGRFVLVNQRFSEIVGRPAEELTGLRMQDITHPEDLPRNLSLFQAMVDGGQPFDITKRYIRPNGSHVWVSNSVSLVRDVNGRPKYVVAVVLDITERIRGEEELRRSEQRLELVLRSINDHFVTYDREWRYTYVNERATEILGRPKEELLGRCIWDLFPDAVGNPYYVDLHRAFAEQRVISSEHFYAPFDAWFQNHIYPSPDGVTVFAADITDRKQTEDVLRRSEARFRRVFESNVVGMIQWDLDRSLILDANDEFLRMTGYTRDDVAAGRLNFRDMTPAEWTIRNEEGIRAIRENGHAVPYEKEYFRKDGSRVPLIIAGTRFDDSPSEGMSLLIDISDRKRAEQEIARLAAESERQRRLYETVLTNTPDLAYVFDLEHRFTYANHALLTMWGKTWEEASGKTCLELGYEPWHAEMQDREIDQVRATKQPIRGEVPFTGTLGQRLYEYIFVPVIAADGEVEAVAGTTRDVTERRQSETDLKASEVRYRRLFESAKDGILILDAHAATIVDANPFIAEMLGYSPGEFEGKELWQIGLFRDAEASKAAMRELQEKGYIRYDDLPLETKAGRRINVEFVSNVYGEDGESVIQCNIRDITDRKRLEDSLRRYAAELSEADRRKDEFLATLAHELRNPLAPMLNGLQVMRLAGGDSAAVEQSRTMMERQLKHMVRLVDDLLDVSRVTTGKLTLRTDRLKLGEVIAAALETSLPVIEQSGHDLSVVIPDEPIFVEGDLTRLAQVVSNLLTNSAKYTHRGGHVRLSVGREDGMAVVSVTDDGIGIPPAMLDNVFQMFIQVDRTLEKTTGGLGIGLTLVRRLVELHGGTVEARSDGPGRGSQFFVRLPVVKATPQIATSQGDDGLSVTAKRRILVVDDNHDSAMSLGMMLKLMGNETHTVHDGLAAVEAAETFCPDLILLDIGLPKLNGYDACRRIRQQAWSKDMLIVALTGWGQEEDRLRSQEAGFDHHLVKPVDAAELNRLLSERSSWSRLRH